MKYYGSQSKESLANSSTGNSRSDPHFIQRHPSDTSSTRSRGILRPDISNKLTVQTQFTCESILMSSHIPTFSEISKTTSMTNLIICYSTLPDVGLFPVPLSCVPKRSVIEYCIEKELTPCRTSLFT